MKKVIATVLCYFEYVLGAGKQLWFISTQTLEPHLNIYCSFKKVQSTDPIKLNDPFVHCLWIKPNAPERLKQAVDKLVTHADIIGNIHQLNARSSDLL